VHYIHLNLGRAGLFMPTAVGSFLERSLEALPKEGCSGWLTAEGVCQRMSAGEVRPVWARYEPHFTEFPGRPEAQAQSAFPTLARGCALGARGWLRALDKDYAQFALSPGFQAG
jgi:hypothetical protein